MQPSSFFQNYLSSDRHRGFTVLEFLIVLAIIILLIAILLPNLNRAREKSDDERRISDLKAVALGLEQYKQICGEYPETIIASETCDESQTNLLGNFITNIGKYKFNESDSDFKYYPISYTGNTCDGYHLGVTLRNEIGNGVLATGDARPFDSSSSFSSCANGISGFNGSGPNMFDIVR